MRTFFWIFVVVVTMAISGRLLARPRPPVPPAPVAPPAVRMPAGKVLYQKDFLGYGGTLESAREHALEQAHEWMVENVHLGWVPPVEELAGGPENNGRGLVTFEEQVKNDLDLPISGKTKVVKAHLSINQAQAWEIQQKGRQERMQERCGLLSRILAGVVALLLIGGGYLRLEEATKGYYTTALRLVAAGLLLVLLLGVCVVG
jgi:hypothetical protein